MDITALEDVLAHELEDLHSAEMQLLEALPKMAAHATSTKLQKGFKQHLLQTEEHVKRIEKASKLIGVQLPGETCRGMQGLIKEGSALFSETPSPAVDAALIAAAERIEHYEMAGYSSAISFAKTLKITRIPQILKKTLTEEEKTSQKLAKLGKTEVLKKKKRRARS